MRKVSCSAMSQWERMLRAMVKSVVKGESITHAVNSSHCDEMHGGKRKQTLVANTTTAAIVPVTKLPVGKCAIVKQHMVV